MTGENAQDGSSKECTGRILKGMHNSLQANHAFYFEGAPGAVYLLMLGAELRNRCSPLNVIHNLGNQCYRVEYKERRLMSHVFMQNVYY